MELKKPFYHGNAAMVTNNNTSSYVHETRDSAIETARKKLAADPSLSFVPIVKVVAIVRRSEPPIVVEEVQ